MPEVSILSVGLDETLLYTRNEVLRQNGFHVAAARNRHEAVLACRGDVFDLALLCHSMPRQEAENLARDLEVLAPNIEVVNLGAWDNVGLEEIRKPEFLLQILQSLLAKRDGHADGHGDGHLLARSGKGDGHVGRAVVAKRSQGKAPRPASIVDPATTKPRRSPGARSSDSEQK